MDLSECRNLVVGAGMWGNELRRVLPSAGD
jgi:hypothetical protein